MNYLADFIAFFSKHPKTFEQQAAEGVKEKTKLFQTKEARFVSHTVYPVYKAGKRPTTFTVYHGAHA
jgi:hypothetical protein